MLKTELRFSLQHSANSFQLAAFAAVTRHYSPQTKECIIPAMRLLEIRKYPDPVLKQVAEKVSAFDAELHTLLDDMAHTMYLSNGIGLAAPQIGVLKRATVIDLSPDKSECIDLLNPEIIWREKKVSSEEGCLSIPDYRDTVSRSETIIVQAQNRNGKQIEIKAAGLLSFCIQHEIDHLDGVLFVDRLSRLKREMFKRWFKKHATNETT